MQPLAYNHGATVYPADANENDSHLVTKACKGILIYRNRRMDINLVYAIKEVASGGFTTKHKHNATKRKDWSPITKKAEAIGRQLELRTEAEATVICPISGLIVPSDLPPTDNAFLVCAHPIVFNALAIIDSNEYVNKLSESQLAGLILAMLHTLGKGSISPKSSAFAVNVRMQALFKKEELLEFAAWVFDNLGRTNAYYPPIELSHETMHKGTFLEYTNWVANLSTDFLASGVEERTIKPTTPSTEVQIKRLDSAAYDEWLDMASKLTLPKSFVDKAKPYIKKLVSTTNEDLINKICSKVEALAKDEAGTIGLVDSTEYLEIAAVGEIFTLEVMAMRKKADKLGYYKAQLDEWDAPISVISVTASSVESAPVVEVAIEKPKKVNFLDLLKKKGA